MQSFFQCSFFLYFLHSCFFVCFFPQIHLIEWTYRNIHTYVYLYCNWNNEQNKTHAFSNFWTLINKTILLNLYIWILVFCLFFTYHDILIIRGSVDWSFFWFNSTVRLKNPHNPKEQRRKSPDVNGQTQLKGIHWKEEKCFVTLHNFSKSAESPFIAARKSKSEAHHPVSTLT